MIRLPTSSPAWHPQSVSTQSHVSLLCQKPPRAAASPQSLPVTPHALGTHGRTSLASAPHQFAPVAVASSLPRRTLHSHRGPLPVTPSAWTQGLPCSPSIAAPQAPPPSSPTSRTALVLTPVIYSGTKFARWPSATPPWCELRDTGSLLSSPTRP